MKKRKLFGKAIGIALLSCVALVSCRDNKDSDAGKPGDSQTTEYTITFNTNGGSTVDSKKVTAGGKLTLPAAPTKAGYTFDGWFTDEACTKAFDATAAINANQTLYAKWATAVKYTVDFVTNGADGISPIEVTAGSTITLPTAPTKAGYTFDGWFTDEALTNAFVVTAAINANTTLYAKWAPIPLYDIISAKAGNIIATKFNDTQISSYDDYEPGDLGFYSVNDTQTSTIKVEVKDEALVVTDTDANASAEGFAEIGFNYEGVIEGTMKYTPVVTDNKAPSKWTLVQFYGYKDVAEDPIKLFGIRTNGTKDADAGNIQIVFEGDTEYYGTAYAYKVNTELEIYWKYDFTTKKLTVEINGKALVSDYDVPEANQPVFLTGLGFVTGGNATVRAPKIDDFAVTSTPKTLDESKASLKSIIDQKVTLMDLDTNYTFTKDQIVSEVATVKAQIDEVTTKEEALGLAVGGLIRLQSVPTDAAAKENVKEEFAKTKKQLEDTVGYTINKTAFDKVFTDANAAIDAATTAAEVQAVINGIQQSIEAIKSDTTIRTEAITEFSEYGPTKYNTLDSSSQAAASEEYTGVMTKYLGGQEQEGLLITCAATSIESTLAAGKAEVDDVIAKYALTLEQYETKLTGDLGSYRAGKTNVEAVLTELAKISIDFTSVTTKDEADVKFEAAKSLVDDVCELYNYIQTQKATLLAYNEDEEAFEGTYGASFTELWGLEADDLIKGDTNLAGAKAEVDAHIAEIRTATEVTVTFMNGTETFDTQTILKNGKATEPEGTPVNEGYVFGGWDFDFNTTISSSISINAIWRDTYSISSQETVTKTWDLIATVDELGAGKTVTDGQYGSTFTLSGGTNKTKNEGTGKVGVSFKGSRITFTTTSDNAILTLLSYSAQGKRVIALDQDITTQAEQSSSWTDTDTVKKVSETIVFTIPTAGTHYISFDNSEHKLTSISLRMVSTNTVSSTITDITADVVAGTDSFTVSNVKLTPTAGDKISITDGYTVEVYNSENQKVDNENLLSGEYTVVVLYGTYTRREYNVEIAEPVYLAPTYSWNGNECTATKECTNVPSLTITEKVTGAVETVTAASVGHNRVDRYVAEFTTEGFVTQYSEPFEVANTALEPEYAAPTYSWDGNECTATKECTNDSSLTITEKVTGAVETVTAASVGHNRVDRYVATFTKEGFATQYSDSFEVANTALEPEYAAPTYVWDEDHKCTATRVCTNDSTYTQTETVTGVLTTVTEASIGQNRVDRYVATFTKEGFATQYSDSFEVPNTMITTVSTEAELKTAVAIDRFTFSLSSDIELTSDLVISNVTNILLEEHTINTNSYGIYASNSSVETPFNVLISNGGITGFGNVINADENSAVSLYGLSIEATGGTAVRSTNGTVTIAETTITAYEVGVLSDASTVEIAKEVTINSSDVELLITNEGTITNNTSYDIYTLYMVSTEDEFITAVSNNNAYIVLKDNITLTGNHITDLNGTVKVIVGEDYYIDNSDVYTIQIGTNCTLICDEDASGIVAAPAGYHIKTTTNTDGIYTFTVEADE